jgi:purine-binding chemotaxis protein CheW
MSMDDAAFVQRVLRLRAQRLAAARTVVEDRPAGTAALCVRVAAELYAIPLDVLTEVLPLRQTTPVPGLSRHLLGVTNVRGEIRPVLNLHDMLGLPEPGDAGRGSVAFLRAPGREVGLRVDEVQRIRFIADDSLTLPLLAGNGLPQRFISGITADTVILLDPHQILALDVLKDRRSDYICVT